jgi:hypothetical protein
MYNKNWYRKTRKSNGELREKGRAIALKIAAAILAGEPTGRIAERFDLSDKHIQNIAHGRRWPGVMQEAHPEVKKLMGEGK